MDNVRAVYELSAVLAVGSSMKGGQNLSWRSKRGCVRYLMGTRQREGSGGGCGSSLDLELHPVNRTSVTKGEHGRF